MINFFKYLTILVVFPILMLLTGCKSDGAFSESTAVNLERIEIIPSPITTQGVSKLTLAAGSKQYFEAIGYYSNGSSRTLTDLDVSDWHVNDRNIGYFNLPGVLIGGNTQGIVTVYASKDGITSNVVSVNVTAAVITNITVTPSPVNIAKGQAEQLTAIATYSDNTSSDVTNSVVWMPIDTATITVTSSGLLSGVDVGMTTLTAAKDGIISNVVSVNVTAAIITNITVTPSPVNIAKGQTEQLTAIATYSDNTSSDVTNSVTWMPIDTATATVTSSGLLSGVDVGMTTLTAAKDGIISNVVSVNVTAAIITNITVTPSPVNIAKGQTEQLTAIATYSDNTSSDVTNSVTWMPIDTATATVTSSGLLSGVDVGTTTLTAAKDGIISNAVSVNVTAAVITNITVTPSSVNVAKGQTEQLTAIATYSDNTSSDVTNSVTWMPIDTATATVTSSGLLSGVDVGTTTLTAAKDGIISNAVSVNVTAAVITNITVTPSSVNVAKGQTEQLTAIATYSDNTSSDVTNSVTWMPIDTATTTVTSNGLLSGVDVGTTTLTAAKDGIISNAVSVNVTAAVITNITVTPSSVNVAKGLTAQLTAIATYSDNTSSDLTNSVTWMPIDTATTTVTSSGLLSGVDVGTTTLTAAKDGIISNVVNVNICANLAGACLDIFDAGGGKLFTNSPSVPYLDSIGGSATNGTISNIGFVGNFYLFNWANANALCNTYNAQNIGGRNNWRLPTQDELKVELYDTFGNMTTARGWSNRTFHWSTTPNGALNIVVSLTSGVSSSYPPRQAYYASCVSNP
ncbi:Ig-like domain-containing protein [Aeromonas caviae]